MTDSGGAERRRGVERAKAAQLTPLERPREALRTANITTAHSNAAQQPNLLADKASLQRATHPIQAMDDLRHNSWNNNSQSQREWECKGRMKVWSMNYGA